MGATYNRISTHISFAFIGALDSCSNGTVAATGCAWHLSDLQRLLIPHT